MDTGEMSFRELPYNFSDGGDALSLSDLPLASNSSEWEEYYSCIIRGRQSPCYDQDFFEFSSEDFSASCDSLNFKDNIVFCGKLIPYREAEVSIRVQEMENNNINSKPKEAGKRSSRSLFTWRSNVNKSRTNSLTSKKVKSINEDGKTLATTSKGGRVGAGIAMRKIPVLSSPLKSRWYLFAFGMGRFPMAMEKSDMKTRQSKKRTNKFPNNDRREMSNRSSSSGSSSRSISNGSVSPRNRGLWSILNNLGCGNYLGASHECKPF